MRISGYSSGISLSETIKSGKTDFSAAANSKVSSAMTDEYIAKIKEHAKKDALTGDYMQDDFNAMKQAYRNKYVSPDRSKAISQVSLMMNSRRTWNYGQNILSLFGFGLPYTANIHKGLTRTTAEIFDQNGEMIAGYHSDNGTWQSVTTTAETQFMRETNRIYRAAWDEARAELAAAGGQAQTGASVAVTGESFSVTV